MAASSSAGAPTCHRLHCLLHRPPPPSSSFSLLPFPQTPSHLHHHCLHDSIHPMQYNYLSFKPDEDSKPTWAFSLLSKFSISISASSPLSSSSSSGISSCWVSSDSCKEALGAGGGWERVENSREGEIIVQHGMNGVVEAVVVEMRRGLGKREKEEDGGGGRWRRQWSR